MDKAQQERFEKFQLMRAHTELLVRLMDAGAMNGLTAQLQHAKAAMEAFLALPPAKAETAA